MVLPSRVNLLQPRTPPEELKKRLIGKGEWLARCGRMIVYMHAEKPAGLQNPLDFRCSLCNLVNVIDCINGNHSIKESINHRNFFACSAHESRIVVVNRKTDLEISGQQRFEAV